MALKPLETDPNHDVEITRLAQDPSYFGDGTEAILATINPKEVEPVTPIFVPKTTVETTTEEK